MLMPNKSRQKESNKAKAKSRMIHVRLSEDLHKDLRIRVAEQDTSIQEWVEETIRKGLKSRSRS